MILRRLETLVAHGGFDAEARDEIAEAMWDLALILEEGDIGDALERMRAAQERLSEAMRNGASEEEIQRLMDELRQATNDYMRQKMQQAQRENRERQQNGEQMDPENSMQMTQQDLQDMMDRIQELMEQGRMAEAQEALEQFQQMMENMRVTEGQGPAGAIARSAGHGRDWPKPCATSRACRIRRSAICRNSSTPMRNPAKAKATRAAMAGRAVVKATTSPVKAKAKGQQPGQRGQGQGSRRQQGQGGQGSLADRQEALRRQLEQQRGNMPGAGRRGGRGSPRVAGPGRAGHGGRRRGAARR